MADNTTSTVSSQLDLPGGNVQTLRFRPGQAGRIDISSTPSPFVAKTETGLLALIELRSPGSATAVASQKFPNSTPSLALAYTATAADLTAAGDWECDVTNETDQPIEFSTTVTFPYDPLPTASIDLNFLNLLLATVVDAAAIQIHLQSSSDGIPQSRVTISLDIAALLNVPAATTFHIADQSETAADITFVYQLLNLDSDPNYPVVFLSTPPLSLTIFIRFDAASAQLVAQNLPAEAAPGIDLDSFSIEFVVGFDGSFTPVCTATAHLEFNDIDLSSDISSAVQTAIVNQLSSAGFSALLDPQQVRGHIDSLFISLMRLGPQAQIQSYTADGQTLTVTYSNDKPIVPPISLSAASLSFDQQDVGTTSAQQTVTITAASQLTISSIAVTSSSGAANDFPSVPPPGNPPGGGSVNVQNNQLTITVWFRPTAAGTRTASMAIGNNISADPLVVQLTGIAVDPPIPLLHVSPGSLSFTPNKGTQSVTLQNTGSAPLVISSIAIQGGNFSATNTCGVGAGAGTLQPGQQCTVTLHCAFIGPGGTSELVITHNAVGSPTMVDLNATSKTGI